MAEVRAGQPGSPHVAGNLTGGGVAVTVLVTVLMVVGPRVSYIGSKRLALDSRIIDSSGSTYGGGHFHCRHDADGRCDDNSCERTNGGLMHCQNEFYFSEGGSVPSLWKFL